MCFVEYKLACRGGPRKCEWMHWVAGQCRQGVLYRAAFYLPGCSIMAYLWLVLGDFTPSGADWSLTAQQFYTTVQRAGFVTGLAIAVLPMMV